MSDETSADIPGSSEQAQGTNIKVEIVVQPPTLVGVRRRLIPPLVARTDHPQLLEDFLSGRKNVFATLMLTASNGTDMTAILAGDYNVGGQGVNLYPKTSKKKGGSSSSQQPHRWIYFVFAGLSIPEPGMYTFTVFVNTLVLSQGFVNTVGKKASRSFTVVAQAVAPARPSSAERQVLQMLEDNNFYNPNA